MAKTKKKTTEARPKSWDKPVPEDAEIILKMNQQKEPQYFVVLGHWNLQSVCDRAMALQAGTIPQRKRIQLDETKFDRGFVIKKEDGQYERTSSLRNKEATAATFYFAE